MSAGIEEIQYMGSRIKPRDAGLSASLVSNMPKGSFIPGEPQMQEYGFQNFAMIIPKTETATYVSAAAIK